MPLWDGIATALDREAADLQRDLGDRIVVDSLDGAEALRTVLLCESPHHAEISHRHPLAGDSGVTVTRAFARNLNEFEGREEPIGCLLYRDPQCVDADGQLPPLINSPVLNSLGLMNVSLLPLDSATYCLGARRQYSELLCYFEAIKSKLEEKTLVQGVQFLRNLPVDHVRSQAYAALRDDLIHRLNQLGQIAQDVMVVPCGRVAKAFFDWATEDCNYQGCVIPYDCFVPHPSRNSWQPREEGPRVRNYSPTIDTLVGAIADRAT